MSANTFVSRRIRSTSGDIAGHLMSGPTLNGYGHKSAAVALQVCRAASASTAECMATAGGDSANSDCDCSNPGMVAAFKRKRKSEWVIHEAMNGNSGYLTMHNTWARETTRNL